MHKAMNLKVYLELDSLHFAEHLKSESIWQIIIFKSAAPRWVEATDTNIGNVMMVSPLNPGESGYTYNQILTVATNEFTYAIGSKIASTLDL